jgi:glycine cleavage system H protein
MTPPGTPPGTGPDSRPDIHYRRSRFSTRLPWDRLYMASHFWVLEAEPGHWRVGLTKFAARMLGDIVDLEFEVADGGPVAVGDVIGSLEGFKARTELYSVLQGSFLGANPALATSLDVLDSDRYGAGWLYAVAGAPDPAALDAAGYAAVLDATIDRMREV